jgi:hypothetical protein
MMLISKGAQCHAFIFHSSGFLYLCSNSFSWNMCLLFYCLGFDYGFLLSFQTSKEFLLFAEAEVRSLASLYSGVVSLALKSSWGV